MLNINILPLLLTLKLSVITTLILLIFCIPISWIIANIKNKKIKSIIETIISMPIVLPPTIMGFYLLLLLGPSGIIGKIWILLYDHSLAFTFTGLVISSCIYSIPFVIQPIQLSFEKINKEIINNSYLLKSTNIDSFITIILPLSSQGILRSIILGFAHTLGEFGIILMVGGNIPGKTQVISIKIYELVEQLEYYNAHILSTIVILMSFILLLILFIINNNSKYDKNNF